MLGLLALTLSGAPSPPLQTDPVALGQERYTIGRAAFERGDYAEAEFIFREVTVITSQFPEPFFALSQILGKLNRRQEAAYFMNEAARRLPMPLAAAAENVGSASSSIGAIEVWATLVARSAAARDAAKSEIEADTLGALLRVARIGSETEHLVSVWQAEHKGI